MASTHASAINLTATGYAGTNHTLIKGEIHINNHSSQTKYTGPLIETDANTFQCVVGPLEIKAFRTALMNPQTPIPFQHERVFELFWGDNNYGRSLRGGDVLEKWRRYGGYAEEM